MFKLGGELTMGVMKTIMQSDENRHRSSPLLLVEWHYRATGFHPGGGLTECMTFESAPLAFVRA